MTPEQPRRRSLAGQAATALFVLVCIIILTSLGVWQVKRLHWKEDLLRRVAAAQTAQPSPLKPVLLNADRGADVEWTRVWVNCGQPEEGFTGQRPEETLPRYTIRDGDIAWRAMGVCWFEPSWGIPLDRGVIEAAFGKVDRPSGLRFPAPGKVTGVLRLDAHRRATSTGRPNFVVVVEHEDPAPPGLTPAPYPTNIPNNHLGYALTWFGLALALAGVYGSALWQRRRSR